MSDPGGSGPWRPIAEAPKSGSIIYVRSITVYKWTPYRPDGQRQMKKAGRWQIAGEYGGWDNAELPEGGEWSATPPLPTLDEGTGSQGGPSTIEELRKERDEALAGRDDFKERLHDLVMIDAEADATGGGPGFKDRRDRAWARAREPFEP